MTSELNRRARRVAAVSLLGALTGIVWLGVAQPIFSFRDAAADARGIALRALKRNRALLREGAAIQAAEASIEQSARWRNFYEGPKAEGATLQLETDLRTIFRDSNNPTSMVAEHAVLRGPVTRIAVRVTLTMRVDQLADTLDRIQKQPRQLRIESLTIQAPEFQGAQANPMLTVQAEIAALMFAPGAERT
jgi:hypothetical protein